LKDKIQNYKKFDKRVKDNDKKSKEEWPNWNHYYSHWKNKKIIYLIWRIKLKAIKTWTKRLKKKTKLKVEGPNQNILHIQIRNQGLNWK
jgi:hypothetical protein